jgi:hypothetical protein
MLQHDLWLHRLSRSTNFPSLNFILNFVTWQFINFFESVNWPRNPFEQLGELKYIHVPPCYIASSHNHFSSRESAC